MQTITLSAIIDKAITLKEGGAIVIPCSSYEDMERTRIKLYKLRNQLAKSSNSLARTIDITRKAKEESWTIYISKEKALLGVLIVEDGEAKPFILEDDEERREALMEEDGVEVEVEVETKTKQEPEKDFIKQKDFDEVAAEIEQAQSLEEE